jgi:hypothetical protein
MLKRTLSLVLAVAATLMAAVVCGGSIPEKDFWGSARVTGPIVVDNFVPILAYRCRGGRTEHKSYVEELRSPAGVQILRDSPDDHRHHHALMFALAADGVDFWSEGEKFGRQKQTALTSVQVTTKNGVSRAAFSQSLDWIEPAASKTVLVEDREIAVFRPKDIGATLVEWRSSLKSPQGKKQTVLTGEHYFGLGMRFVPSMDGGRFFNSDDKQGEVVRGDERLTPVKWCAYTAKAEGKPVTVAVFDHPDNFRHPAKMFTMTKPFAYLSATRNEWKEPITVKADEPLELFYAVAVWDGEVDKATIEKLYQSWLKVEIGK